MPSCFETGEALIEVARNAHKAEQELAQLKRRITEEFSEYFISANKLDIR